MHLLWPGSETRTRISSFNEKFERIEWDRGVGRRSHFPFRPLQSLLERLKRPKGSKGSNGKKRNSEAIEFPSSRDLLATQKSEYAGLNIVEIGILSFSPPLFSTYSYSKEGKKSLVQPRNHLFQARSIKYLKGFSSVHLPILFSVSLSRFHASLHRSIWRSSRNIRLEQRYIVFAIVERWKLAMLNWLDNFWKR